MQRKGRIHLALDRNLSELTELREGHKYIISEVSVFMLFRIRNPQPATQGPRPSGIRYNVFP